MRHKFSIVQKMTLRQVVLIFSSIAALLTVVFILIINVGDNRQALAAVTNDYRSVASGNWNTLATWQRYNGFSWVAATSVPNSTHNIITIQNGHTVTVTANATIDQVVINSGGTVVINSGITATLANGTGTDLDITGTLRSAGIVTINTSATIIYQNGGTYQHNYTTTAGTIPTATWNAGSTCEVIGYTNCNTPPAGLQAFRNFTWNCPLQTQDINLGGGLTTVNGNLTIQSTGSNYLIMSTSAYTLNITGDFIQSDGNFQIIKGNPSTTVNLTGNFNQTGGVFHVSDGNGNTTINISGNMTHTGGTIMQTGSGTVPIIFNISGTQIYNSSGNTVSGNIDYTVNSGSTFDVGTSIVNGRNFTLSSGGSIRLASPDGIWNPEMAGNIQVSGSRTFSTGASYIYDGTAAQTTGNALPSTIQNLTIDNSNNVTLNNTTAVSGILTLTNGKLITGSNEINITNTSTSAISGYNSTKYIAGNLRRSITGTGTYNFPVGIAANYELLTLNLSSVTGTTNILAKFTNANPVTVANPLSGVIINGITMERMLTYGYWTLIPNNALLSGSYSITVTEIVSNLTVNSGCTYALLYRQNDTFSWASQGTHSSGTQSVSGNAVTAARSAVNVFGDFGIGYGELLSFGSAPTLQSGTAGQVNAIYVFPDVCSNVDAWIQILAMDGGMTLNSIDNYSMGNGYQEGWQPFVNAPANTTSSILWKISFKVAGTSTDTILPSLAISGVDIDAGSSMQEFVEATYPYSYGLAPSSTLIISNNNGNYRATANASAGSIANIDTGQTQAMFQINYRNINSFFYRTGVISNNNSTMTRQTSLYFKSFFSSNYALPIKLKYFNGSLTDDKVKLTWSTASETNNSYFTIERSVDGENFDPVLNHAGAGNSSMTLYYAVYDENPLKGVSYYRLKQTDYDGKSTYSDVVRITNNKNVAEGNMEFKSVSPNPFTESVNVQFYSETKSIATISIINSTGQVILKDEIVVNEGYNNHHFSDLTNLTNGVYFISLTNGETKLTRKIIRK